MYLKQTKRNGRVFLSVVRSYREDGRVRSKTVERIGYADDYADRYADPVAHFRAYVKELNERARAAGAPVVLSLESDALIEAGRAGGVQLGAAIALGYLDALGCGRFFGAASRAAGPDGAGRIFELLTCARMLHAVPVHETWNARGRFPRACPGSYADAFRAMEVFAERAQAFCAHLNRRYEALHGARALERAHLVFSNHTFRWGREAPAGPDEARSQGEARLCLLIDGEGIPLAYRIVERDMGLRRMLGLMDELKAQTGAQRITLVAARIADAEGAIEAVTARGDGVVLLQPAESFSRELGAWVADDDGYATTRNGAYLIKSRLRASGEARRAVPLKEIALRSAQAPAGTSALCIVSSEVERSDAYVFNLYRELWRVHEPFQVIPADFIAMPYAVPNGAHLQAHFLMCYTAFFALRVLRQDMGWRYDAAQVADALLAMEGAYVDQGWYVFNYRTDVTDAIERAAGAQVGRRIMRRADVRRATAQAARNAGRFRVSF